MQYFETFESASSTEDSSADAGLIPSFECSNIDWSQIGCQILFQVPNPTAPIDLDVRCPEVDWSEISWETYGGDSGEVIADVGNNTDLLKAALDSAGITPEDGLEEYDICFSVESQTCGLEFGSSGRKRKLENGGDGDGLAKKLPRQKLPRSSLTPPRSCPIQPIKRTMKTARPMRINLLKRRAQKRCFCTKTDLCCDRQCCLHWKWISRRAVFGDFS